MTFRKQKENLRDEENSIFGKFIKPFIRLKRFKCFFFFKINKIFSKVPPKKRLLTEANDASSNVVVVV